MDLQELNYEILKHLDSQDYIAFCSSNKKLQAFCNQPNVLNLLKSKINTNYNIENFNYDELSLFSKTNELKKRLSIDEDYIIVFGKKIKIYDMINNIYVAELDNDNIYQIYIHTVYRSMHILILGVIKTNGEVFYIGVNQFNGIIYNTGVINHKSTINNIIHYQYNRKEEMYLISKNGDMLKVLIDNFKTLSLKNIVQIEGSFFLHKDGSVYIELSNGQIYHPGLNKYFNYNPPWTFYFFNNIKYYKLNIENVKQITNLGHCVTYDGEVFEFNWSTKEVISTNLTNVKQIELDNKNNIITLTNDGDIFYHDRKLNHNIIEMHSYNNKVISMTEEDVIVLDLITFEEITFKI